MRIGHRVTRPALNEMMGKAHVLDALVGRGFGIVRARRLIEEAIDGGRDQLDVPNLLGGNAGHQLIEGRSFFFCLKATDWCR
jgi:hypothetical protein